LHDDARASVLIIPGIGGTALRSTVNHERMWIPLSLLAPKGRLNTDAWKLRMRVRYNAARDEFACHEALEAYEGLDAVRKLSGHTLTGHSDDAFGPLIEHLQAQRVRVHAFGYDFRIITGKRAYAHACERLVDTLQSLDRGRGVVVVAHSFGGVLFRSFCQHAEHTDALQRHVRAFVPVAAPFGGSVVALRSVLTGATLNVCPIGPREQHAWFQSVLNNYACMLACLPVNFCAIVVQDDAQERHEYKNESSIARLLFETGNHNAVQAWVHNVQPWLQRARAPGRADQTVRTVHTVVARMRANKTARALSFTRMRAQSTNRYAERRSFAANYTCDIVDDDGDGDGVVAVADQRSTFANGRETVLSDTNHISVLRHPQLHDIVLRCTSHTPHEEDGSATHRRRIK